MKILVTGGSGMLGSAILRMFHQQHELHFTARNTVIAKQLAEQFDVIPHIVDLRATQQFMRYAKVWMQSSIVPLSQAHGESGRRFIKPM